MLLQHLTLTNVRLKSRWFLLGLAIIILDQLSKTIAVDALDYSQPLAFLPFFNFTLLHNYGAAFSFLSDAGGWQRWFFGVIAFAVSILLVVWILMMEPKKKLELAGLSLILGGAVGNLWDRIALGYVVDFVDWYYPVDAVTEACLPFFYFRPELLSCHWPAFNVADAAILMGVCCLFIDMFLNKGEQSS